MFSALRRSGLDSVRTATPSVVIVRTSVAIPASCLGRRSGAARRRSRSRSPEHDQVVAR
jgi:hypothetical protein